MATEWRSQDLISFGPAAGWTIGPLGAGNSFVLCNWNPGETVLRTRVQGQFTGRLTTIAPATDLTGPYLAGGTLLAFGVWANPAGSASDTPPSPDSLTYDPNFIFNNVMELDQFDFFTEQVGTTEGWQATYRFESADKDSHSKRGPNQNDNNIFISWSLFGPLGPWWTTDSSPEFGFFGYALRFSVLIDHV